MIKVTSLSQKYAADVFLRFADWKVEKGEHWLILGRSGSGKTTLLHTITGLLRPWEGAVEVNGHPLYELKPRDLDRFRGRNIGIVFQRPHLIKSLSVVENVRLAQLLAGYEASTCRAMEVLESLSIASEGKRYPHELSEGQLQRASIARAVVNRPALLVADEPTSSLDDRNAAVVLDILAGQAKSTGATLVVATHDQRIKPAFSFLYNLS